MNERKKERREIKRGFDSNRKRERARRKEIRKAKLKWKGGLENSKIR